MLYNPDWKPDTIELQDWQKVLLDAAELLETEGWIKGSMQNQHGFCMIGAVMAAANQPIIVFAIAKGPAGEALDQLKIKTNDSTIWGWNDHPERTKQEVIDMLRETAKG
jgi:hypothetical protein